MGSCQAGRRSHRPFVGAVAVVTVGPLVLDDVTLLVENDLIATEHTRRVRNPLQLHDVDTEAPSVPVRRDARYALDRVTEQVLELPAGVGKDPGHRRPIPPRRATIASVVSVPGF